MCKRGNALSLRVLIGRGLDLSLSFSSKIIPRQLPLPYVSQCLPSEMQVLIRFSGLLHDRFALTVGVDYGEVPPVPIPNTEVKLVRAENTWRAAFWKDRSVPTPMSRFLWSGTFFMFF